MAFETERPRWFLWAPVFVGVGALVYFALPVEPSVSLALGALACALIFQGLPRKPLGTFTALLAGVLVSTAVGFAAAKLRAQMVAAPVLSLAEEPRYVAGFVELVEAREEGGRRLTLRPIQIGEQRDGLPWRVRVSLRAELVPPETISRLLPGAAVAVLAQIGPPPRAAIPGGYDFSRFAYFRRLGGIGYGVAPLSFVDTEARLPLQLRLENAIARLRHGIGDRIEAALPGQNGAIAKALITGDRSSISAETNEDYRASGLFHILSISGLHMAIMGGSVFFAVRFCLALFPGLALRYPIKKWAAAAAIAGALGYLLISGGSYATLRSFLMIAVFFFAVLVDRPAIAMRNVALSALLLLLVFPESVIDPGFQMSFAAVVALVAAYEAVAARSQPPLSGAAGWFWRAPMFLAGIVGSTLVASLAVAPLGIYHFHQTQHFAVLANLVAVPVSNVIVMPAALATLLLLPLGLEGGPLWIMGQGLEIMGTVARWVADLGGVSFVPAVPLAAVSLVVAGGLWICLWRRSWRLLGCVAVLGGLAVAPLANLPDVLVGEEGRLVVVRGGDGRLYGRVPRSGEFVTSRWLAHVGDPREPGEVSLGPVMACDATGCVARAGQRLVAMPQHPSALGEDCRRADILVSRFQVTRPCPAPILVIEPTEVRREGTHALYFQDNAGGPSESSRSTRPSEPARTQVHARPQRHETVEGANANASGSRPGTVRLETVSGSQGQRPWSAIWQAQQPANMIDVEMRGHQKGHQ